VLLILSLACSTEAASTPTATVAAAVPDGKPDCPDDLILVAAGHPQPGLPGSPTTRAAAMIVANDFLETGDALVQVEGTVFSIVRTGREVVVITVSPGEAGGYFANYYEQCG
jgi:hypothetical protein